MTEGLHQAIMAIHIAGGLIALLTGAVAATARKGGRLHARAGTGFVLAMLVLGVTAAILEPYRVPPGSPVGGIIVCYFVLTAWMTARRRDGAAGRFEAISGALALGGAGLMGWAGLTGETSTPAGAGPVFLFAILCLVAGLGDLNAVRLGRLAPARRIARHLWRMLFAFFIATGSFFLGQQDVMPEAVQGSPWLFVPALAPFAVMAFWLVRLRISNKLPGLRHRPVVAPGGKLSPVPEP